MAGSHDAWVRSAALAAIAIFGCGKSEDSPAHETGCPTDDCDEECETECYYDPPPDFPQTPCASNDECDAFELCLDGACQDRPEGYCDENVFFERLELPGTFEYFPADVDGDGRSDLVVLDESGSLATHFYESRTEARTVPSPLVGGVDSLSPTDLDADGRAELVGRSWMPEGVVILRADALGAYVEEATIDFPAYHLSAGDFDADGAADLIVGVAETTQILRGDGALGFVHAPELDLPRAGWGYVVGELDGIPGNDVAFVGDVVTVAFGAGPTGWTAVVEEPNSNSNRFPHLVDADGDGITELFLVDQTMGVLAYQGIAGDPFSSHDTHHSEWIHGPFVGVGDFTGDDAIELAVQDMSLDIMLIHTPSGCWTDQQVMEASDRVRVLDFDGDGRDDIAVGAGDTLLVLFGA